MKTKTQRGTAREKIVEVASDLFYRQGYQATGVNQIIDEAGVSKTTFYAHFASKEELGVAYLRQTSSRNIDEMRDAVRLEKDPYRRYVMIAESMVDWMKEMDFRGCNFMNVVMEITDEDHPMRKEVRYHNDALRSLIRDVTRDLIKSYAKYEHLDVDAIADTYYLLLEGGLLASQDCREVWPLHRVADAVKNLVEVKC